MTTIDREWWGVAAGLVLAGVGWGVHSTLLALAGTLGAITALLLWTWQRNCLTGVTYRRTLGQQRALFGEHVNLDVELVNDKLLPLTWLHVADHVPYNLSIRGGAVDSDPGMLRPEMHHLLPMLPYQRIRRRLTVICDRRGEHTFGPARISSGNPVGTRARSAYPRQLDQLLVYPKQFRLSYPSLPSRVLVGEQRARRQLVGDPTRPVGVRDYRAGDPIRHVDWRATARGPDLLVRVFESTAALQVAVFADISDPPPRIGGPRPDVGEFTIAVTASILTDLVGRRVTTGVYSTGSIKGVPVVRRPSSSATALPNMLELLARCQPGGTSIAQLLLTEGSALHRNVTMVLVAADFPDATVRAVTELGQRVAVTLVWVASDQGRPPPPGLGDTRWEVSYRDDWKEQAILELAQ